MKKLNILCILIALVLFAAACSAENETIGIRGKVKSISAGSDTVAVLIEGNIEKDTAYDKASVTVSRDTQVVLRNNGIDSPASMADINVGDTVEVVFKGAVAESYPVQGTAKIIRILG